MIQRLGSDVISELRSGVALTCLAQCVEEVAFNSIDAGAASITIDVDISTISFEVNDNGLGIRQNDLRNIGQRYFTSKCKTLVDLENASSYGFRGEALSSLMRICEKVEIISRHKSSNRTFCKLIRKGQDMGVYESTTSRARHGTTLKSCGAFYTLPVRQKRISEKVDLEQIRRRLLAIVLMNPEVSFLVRNKENGITLLQTNTCTSVLSVISQLFGCSKSKAFKPISHSSSIYTLKGYVNLQGFLKKSLQFFYVNKRLVLKTRFHNVANEVLSKGMCSLLMPKLSNQDDGSKKLDKYPGFVINLECPYNMYDITFDPDKTLVEFENWVEPISCLKGCLEYFLKEEGVFKDDLAQETRCGLRLNAEEFGDTQEGDSMAQDVEVDVKCSNVAKKAITPSGLKRSLCSSTAKRKRSENADSTSELKSSKRGVCSHLFSSSNDSGYLGETIAPTAPNLQCERNLKEYDLTALKNDKTHSLGGSNDLVYTSYSVGSATNCSTDSISKSNRATSKPITASDNGHFGTSINDIEPSKKNPEWLLQYEPHYGQPVYLNLRTGNTSTKLPPRKPKPSSLPLREKKIDSKTLRPLHTFAPHLTHNFTPWLPKIAQECPNRESEGVQEDRLGGVGKMYDKWTNPVFERSDKTITDASFTDGSKTSRSSSALKPFKFTKDCFSKMKVINQVDKKFILCYYHDYKNEESLLVVVDQHAAHERVRLETFTKDLFNDSSTLPANKMAMKSSYLNPPCEISLSEYDMHLMESFKAQLQQVGITFEDPSSSIGSQRSVRIRSVPSVFLTREDYSENLRSEMKSCVEELIKEQIEALLSSKGAQTALPKAITRLLNSHACHGAIRFGDPLSHDECVDLISSLSKCDLPFQCAHGRPSMIPLINTNSTQHEMSMKVARFPRIWRIKNQIQGKLK